MDAGEGGLLDLTDDDVADAMREIPGYLDITTDDFRELYRVAAAHALARMAGHPLARELMRADGLGLSPEQPLDEAVAVMAERRVKSAAVIDTRGLVIGILSETDVLRHLHAESVLDLLVRLAQDPAAARGCCAGLVVRGLMTAPAQMVGTEATLPEMVRAFGRHPGRTMPVVDADGHLQGMLARKDLVRVCRLGL
jgi:CBS domain-containing membrane protein